jgi:CRISPR/Cas system-associated exonuclease Cas4 (RecB family)
MKPFLQRLAEEIAQRFSDDPGSVCVVLPNRRAGLYLRKYLAAALNRTAWAPQMFSIEDFVTNLSGYRIIDPAGLLFELYAIHRDLEGERAQDFDQFADWGQVLLKDFDEIDQYLADPEKVFTYLDEARALSVWNLGERPLTDHEKEYIRFYQSFRIYYSRLNERLLAKKEVYQGLAYRIAAENISVIAETTAWKRIFFAGLNALTTAEERIIDRFIDTNRSEIFWDADEYYVRDEGQEAGRFIREHLKRWPSDPVRWLERDLLESEKTIRVFGIPKGTGQAIRACQIIRENLQAKSAQDQKEKEPEARPDNTALVLADESLLLPVLYSLPEEAGPVNVTMGFPFRFTNLYQLVYQLFQLQENGERFSPENPDSPPKFYARDVLKLLSHPYLFLWAEPGGRVDDPDSLADATRMRNRVFLSQAEIMALASEISEPFRNFLGFIFDRWSTPGKAMAGMLNILESLRARMQQRQASGQADHALDLEYLYHFSRIIRRCSGLMEDYPYVGGLKSLRRIIFQVLDMNRLPFYGEPLKGLQVMGVLETRAIDFENLILLSANEGTLPSGRTPNTFIPFDIKLAFGLPTFQQKDAVFAYHFYRMIQRTRNIHLLYDTEGDLMKGGEKSRFITQIMHELGKKNSRIHITENLLSPPPLKNVSAPVSMPKTPAVMNILLNKAPRGFSPSAINLFIRCPLQFCFQEVLGITESEEIEETIEAKTMGTAIHEVLYNIYHPFTGEYVDPDVLSQSLKATESLLRSSFSEYYREGDLEHGKNHLIFKVSLFLVNQFIRNEIGKLNEEEDPMHTLRILHLEKTLDATIECNSGSGIMQVKIKGKADRVDQWGETVRVIDYKTGSVRQDEIRVKSWDDLRDDPKMAKAFQLLVYAYLYYRNNAVADGGLVSGNITLRKISDGLMRVRLPDEQTIGKETMDTFETILVEVIGRIMDPGEAFNQTENLDYCTNCPFRGICSR